MAEDVLDRYALESWRPEKLSGAMLKVTINNKQGFLETWELEGKLSGEWVIELKRCWMDRIAQQGVPLQVNLKSVSFIDAAGKQLLKEMHMRGVKIKGCGCMIRAVVEEITRPKGGAHTSEFRE